MRRKQRSRRASGKVRKARLSLCMVVKDEDERMAWFFERVKGLADETVVVDTGSLDGTVEVAKRLGARVVRYPWNDDFSEVRNVSLQHATGDWILTLDVDEAIHRRDFAAVRQTVHRNGADAYRMLTRNYSGLTHSAGWRPRSGEYPDMERGYEGWYPTLKVRLFKRRAHIRFRGCVHELVESSVLESGGVIGNCPVPIHHFRAWDVGSRGEKGEFYLRLGRKKVEQQPQDPRAHFELGIQYLKLDRLHEAEALLRKSVALQEGMPAGRLLAVYHSPSTAHTMLGVTLKRLGRPEEALAQYRKAVELNPQCVEALINWGLLLENRGLLAKAHEKYLTALGVAPDNYTLKNHLGRIRARMGADTVGTLA